METEIMAILYWLYENSHTEGDTGARHAYQNNRIS